MTPLCKDRLLRSISDLTSKVPDEVSKAEINREGEMRAEAGTTDGLPNASHTMTAAELSEYGFLPVATVRITNCSFEIETTDEELVQKDKCIYAFLVGGEVIRIGSCKRPLARRLKDWERDVTKALKGEKSHTPDKEASVWKDEMRRHGHGTVFARRGTCITTPVGTFRAYLDEESILIGKHTPRLNRSKHR